MPLRNTHDLPPYGFQVYVAETNWQSTPYTGLEATVIEVQRHREANKAQFGWATDRANIEQWVLQFTEARLRSMVGGDQWLAPGPSESPPANFRFPPRQPQSRPGRSAAELPAKPMAGVGTIISWLGDGLRPADQATADHRASVCARCELNVRMEGFEKAIGTVGDIMHSIMEAKNHMKLATPHDSMLHQCSACLCVLKTKVWVGAEHIKNGMTPDVEAKLAPACWIRPLLAVST